MIEQKQLDLGQLSLEDTRFRISEFFSSDRLAVSIKKIGLLHPLLVTAREDRLVLVSGWKRLSACLELGVGRIPALILHEPDDLTAFLFGLSENLAFREFTLLEKAGIVDRLHAFGMARSRIMRDILPILQVPPTAFYLEGLFLISRLDASAKKLIAGKNLPFPVARQLAEFDAKDLQKILPLLLPLGQNKQKEVLENLLEISKMRNISVGRILARPGLRVILQSSKWPPGQKSERIRAALRKERFPVLTSWEDAFQSALRELGWPRNVSLEAAPFFETDKLEASFRFKDEREFKDRLRQLLDISSRRDFRKLFIRPRRTAGGRRKKKA